MRKIAVLVLFGLALAIAPAAVVLGAEGPVVVQGTVSDAVTGLPIAGAYIMFAEELQGGYLNHLGAQYTGSDGFYSFAAVSGAKYKVIATYPELGVYVGDNKTKMCSNPGTYVLDFDLQPFAQ